MYFEVVKLTVVGGLDALALAIATDVLDNISRLLTLQNLAFEECLE